MEAGPREYLLLDVDVKSVEKRMVEWDTYSIPMYRQWITYMRYYLLYTRHTTATLHLPVLVPPRPWFPLRQRHAWDVIPGKDVPGVLGLPL